MKAFLLVCLAIAVKAEADPQLLLQQPLVGSPIYSSPIISSALPVTSYIAGQPIVQLAEKKPVDEKVEVEVESYSAEKPELKKVVVPSVYTTAGVAGWPYSPITYTAPVVQNLKVVPRYQAKNGDVEHIVYKREADAQFLAASPLAYNAHTWAAPSVYNAWASPIAHPVVYGANIQGVNALTGQTVTDNRFNGQNYAAKGQYVAKAAGVNAPIHIAKRSADADAQILAASPLAYNAHSWAVPSVYGAAVVPSVYGAAVPAVYGANFQGVNALTGQTITDNRFNGQNYAAKGQYIAKAAGVNAPVHIAKREAEADPAVIYRGLYNYAAPSVYSSVVSRPAVYSSNWVRPAVYSNVYSGLARYPYNYYL